MKKGPSHQSKDPDTRIRRVYPMHDTSTLVMYDLRGPEQWEQAGRDRRAWGRSRAEIHTLDNDHIVIEFKAGGALELSA